MLVVNVGIFIPTAVAAWVAFEQARRAHKQAQLSSGEREKAETARAQAVAAQEAAASAQADAAEALKQANRIAKEAKQIVEAAEARKLERHMVRWEPVWDRTRGKWYLVNRGPDVPRDVQLTAQSWHVGHLAPKTAKSVAVDKGISLEFPDYRDAGGSPDVQWTITWRTPLGALCKDSGKWGH